MTNRKARVTELIQRELSSILARDHAFPDVLVTVTDVDLTPDFKNAHIFIGVIGPAAKQQAVVDKLNTQRGLLSSRVAKRVVLKNSPHFFFKLDHSVERGVRVTALMEQIDQQLNESALLNPDPAEAAPTPTGPALANPAPAPAAAIPAKETGDEDEDGASGNDRPLRRRNR
ncbi:MAG: 30S ribosome-binding factor RbfA [Verrucomicrobiota bacterium]